MPDTGAAPGVAPRRNGAPTHRHVQQRQATRPRVPHWVRHGLVGLVLSLCAWTFPHTALMPRDTIDFDYRAALEAAMVHRQAFGPSFNFTYGPLAALSLPALFFRLPALVGVLGAVALHAATTAIAYGALRRSCRPLTAVLLTYLVAVAVDASSGPEVIGVVAAAGGLALLERTRPVPGPLSAASGALVAVAALVKVSLGPFVALPLVLGIVLDNPRWRRDLGVAAGAGVVVFVAVWLASGGSLLDIPSWVRTSLAYSSGYPAMAIETPGRGINYVYATIELAAALALAAWRAVADVRDRRWVRAAAIAVIVLAPMWLLAKEGFVRHDAHDLVWFAGLPILLAAVATVERRPRLLGAAPAVVIGALAFLLAVGGVPPTFVQPNEGLAQLARSGADVLVGSRAAAVEQSTKAGLRAAYQLPPTWVALLRGHRMAVDPFGQPVGYAYGLDQVQMPTIQGYTAYTPLLDGDDARFWSGPGAPEYVLELAATIDGRDEAWDPPAAELALRCHYAPVATSAVFELMRHIADRCGRPVAAGAVTVPLGRAVDVPAAAPGEAIVATVTVGPSLLGRVWGAVLKGSSYTLVDGATSYRYLSQTGGELHLLDDPTSPNGLPTTPPTVRHIAVTASSPALSAGTVQIRFYRMAVTPPPPEVAPG